MALLDHVALEQSSVVANSRMNRQRRAEGVNSYERELGFSPIGFLAARIDARRSACWLDLCCGEGRALVDAARRWPSAEMSTAAVLHGIDLVDFFAAHPVDAAGARTVNFTATSLHDWTPSRRYDLITCVHGLHYVGDKLGLVERVATWLSPDGLFAANLDLANIVHADGRPLGRQAAKRLRACGFEFNARRHLLVRRGPAHPKLGFRYLGANDAAGANYSGQEAVNSHYSTIDGPPPSRTSTNRKVIE